MCPCGCGAETPVNVGNVWHKKIPYWSWECTKDGCERVQEEQKNQSGDPICPWCHHHRRFVGHFQPGENKHFRFTVKGERVARPRSDDNTHFSLAGLWDRR